MSDFINDRACEYAKNYELIPFAGSDNHHASLKKRLGGMATEKPINDVRDFISAVLSRKAFPFRKDEDKISFI